MVTCKELTATKITPIELTWSIMHLTQLLLQLTVSIYKQFGWVIKMQPPLSHTDTDVIN